MVRQAVLFGSHLTESPTVGDLDIVIDVGLMEPEARKHSELVLARANETALNGRHFQSFAEKLHFPVQEVRSFLKARSRTRQLWGCDDGILKIAEHRVICEPEGKARAGGRETNWQIRLVCHNAPTGRRKASVATRGRCDQSHEECGHL